MTRPHARRTAAALTLGTATAVLFMGVPAASAAALAAPTLSTTTFPANQITNVTISGSGCLDGQAHPGGVVIHGDKGLELGDGGQAQADGTWSITTTIGAGSTEGVHQILVSCDFYPAESDYPPVTITVGTSPTTTTTTTPAPAPKPLASVDRNTFDKITNGTPFNLGERFKASYPGFKPFEVVTLVLHSTPQNVGTFTADANGVVTVSFAIPAGTATGSHSLTMSGNMGTSFAQALKVSSTRSLAYTGTDIAAPLAIGGVLLLVGGGLTVVARRRKAGAQQA